MIESPKKFDYRGFELKVTQNKNTSDLEITENNKTKPLQKYLGLCDLWTAIGMGKSFVDGYLIKQQGK